MASRGIGPSAAAW